MRLSETAVIDLQSPSATDVGGTTASTAYRVQLPVIHGVNSGSTADNANFFYWLTARLEDRALFFSYLGATWRNKTGILTIFYK